MTAKEWAEELDRRLDAMGLTIQEDGMAVAEALIREAMAEEREACAAVGWDMAGQRVSDAILARGVKK